MNKFTTAVDANENKLLIFITTGYLATRYKPYSTDWLPTGYLMNNPGYRAMVASGLKNI